LSATLEFIWSSTDIAAIVSEVEISLIRENFVVDSNVNIKNYLIVTAMINDLPVVLQSGDYDVSGFSTAILGTRSLIVSYAGFERSIDYTIVLNHREMSDDDQVSMQYLLAREIVIFIDTPGHIETFWYYFSENAEDMQKPLEEMTPRFDGLVGETLFHRVIAEPLDEDGYLQRGFYFIFVERNGNLNWTTLVIKVD
jgi:hypothetical protein